MTESLSQNAILFNMLDFLKHLRLNYQFFILSGPFLLGGLFSPRTTILQFLIQFISIHGLLFGGVTAYNSYYDKDTGPIGGLEHPPIMKKWMLYASWGLQGAGLLIALVSGWVFSILYVISVLFFWLYSSPHTRWKGSPTMSFVAIGIATVVCSFGFGYISFGGQIFNYNLLIAAFGATCLVLSMYPLSQLYQIEADKKRGDTTFAVKYGLKGVRTSFIAFFDLGGLLLSYSFLKISNSVSVISLLVEVCVGLYVYTVLKKVSSDESAYKKIMKTKYISGMAFSIMILTLFFFT